MSRLPISGLPRRGNAFTRWFGRRLLGCLGWRIEGALPDAPKLVLIVAPHTSNWDFIVGIACVISLGLEVHWVGKKSLFKGLLAPLLTFLGGIPVDRRQPGSIVADLVTEFEKRGRLLLCLTPEGTRSPVSHWKSGFFRIARGAGVPMAPVFFDYRRKVVGFFPTLFPREDLPLIQEWLRQWFGDVTPKIPRNFVKKFTLSGP